MCDDFTENKLFRQLVLSQQLPTETVLLSVLELRLRELTFKFCRIGSAKKSFGKHSISA